MYVIFLGAPGAGKGTQAAEVAKELKLAHIATGDMFRDAQKKGTALGLKAKEYMEKGQLVPDELTVAMLLERIAQPDCAQGVIFDGFPRTTGQAEALDKAFAKQGKQIDKVVYIKVPDEELMGRLGGRWICRSCQTPYHEIAAPPKVKGKCDKCGGELYQRADDQPATIKNRLQVFHAQTSPLIEYYKKTGKLTEVNGTGAVDEIRKNIIGVLKKGASPKR
ncbi:MAG TPA: adenylate kinase [Dehalococcoidales bacterium]|nr:adenylate kinase [Dehalococcoidales bacterium]